MKSEKRKMKNEGARLPGQITRPRALRRALVCIINMKVFLVLLLLGLISSSSTNYRIHGVLKDYITLDPAISVVVLLSDTSGNNIYHTISDKKGFFQFDDIPIGLYRLEMQQAGYERIEIVNIELKQDLALNEVYLFEGSYFWDGYITKKGKRIKKHSKMTGGYHVGLIEQNPDETEIYIKNPIDSTKILKYKVVDRKLQIDYNELIATD
jgi:hypothetical protein